MHRRGTFPLIPPLIPPESVERNATISRHDSVNSAQDLEITRLQRKIRELRATEARLSWGHDQVSQELKECKSNLAKEKQEARTFAGKLSKESRNSNALIKEMAVLREDTECRVRDVETKLDHERKKRAKNQQDANKTTAELNSQLDAKQSVIKKLEARVPDKKRHLHTTQAEMGSIRANVYHQSNSLTRKPNTGEPSPIQSNIVSELHDTIKHLNKENARLQNTYHDDGCGEYRNIIAQQLRDARGLQAAAEAETEGLRHLAKANADLMDENAIQVTIFKALIQETDRYGVGTAEELLVERQFVSSLTKEMDAAIALKQPLGFSAITHLCTAPIAPEDNKTEVAVYMNHLRAAELEVEVLHSESNDVSSKLYALEHQPLPALELSTVFCLVSEPKVASSSKSSLKFSGLQTVSTTPRMPASAGTPLTDPSLLAGLEDLGKSIMSLSTVPPLKVVVKPSTKLQVTPLLPNVALTINIQPTDKRNYSLLQRVQSAVSATSSLDIHGPKEAVKQFVASMHDVEMEHAEKSQLAIQLEKAAKQHCADIEALEAQIVGKRKCLDPEHRMMADELEAKNVQFAMQEQLLADWGKRSG
ncbi:hypothetical protein G6011_04829 [Alternaria panax]|uniref:Uncharacterized protein n=1 Tax=Alternaria panax TaxID=48097 RepID=A0AAD4II73_9PLEO|nr:hypothetical protein G6011_04829 [Alternaria panax]